MRCPRSSSRYFVSTLQRETVMLAAKSLPESLRHSFLLRVTLALQKRGTMGITSNADIAHAIDNALSQMGDAA